MNKEEVLTLINAGFSADEIRSMLTPDRDNVSLSSEEAPAELREFQQEAAPEQKEEKPPFDIAAEVKKALQPFEDLYKHMSKLAGMPSLDGVAPKGVDDIISGFFKKE